MKQKYWQLVKIGFLALVLIGIMIFGVIQQRQRLNSEAGSDTVQLFFKPSTLSLDSEANLEIWANTSTPVAFAKIQINFDPAKVKLTQEIIPAAALSQEIQVTAVADANNDGFAIIALGLKPEHINQPPNGVFHLASIKIAPNTTAQNLASEINFDQNNFQVVSLSAGELTLAGTTNAALTVNPNTAAKPGDLTGDGQVDIFDYNLLVANFNNPYTIFDYNLIVANFGS